MSAIERLTVTMPAELAEEMRGAVEAGDYASTSEVVREAVRDWKVKRSLRFRELTALQAEIELGLADVAAGRVREFDAGRIIERGRRLLGEGSSSG